MSKNLEELMSIVSENADQVDGDFTGEAVATSKPSDVSRAELQKMMQELSEEEKTSLFNNTNNTEVIGLCAKGPHIGQYVVEAMGREALECDSKVEGYMGKVLPVKLPKAASVPWDGYALRLPDGSEIYIRRDKMIDWLLSNTLGRIVGGDEGRMLRVVEKKSSRNSAGLNAESSPLQVQRKGISPSNPDHIIVTYEIDTEADGTPKEGVTRTVALDAGEAVDDNGNKLNLRGKVTDFPVFRRKAEFIEALGQINTGRGSAVKKINKGVEAEDAVFEYLELLTKHRGGKL